MPALIVIALLAGNEATAEPAFLCRTSRHIVRVDKYARDDYRYTVWNKPATMTQKPDLVLDGGRMHREGTGPCAYQIWAFDSDNVRYQVNTMGCFGDRVPPPDSVGELSVVIDGVRKARWWCTR